MRWEILKTKLMKIFDMTEPQEGPFPVEIGSPSVLIRSKCLLSLETSPSLQFVEFYPDKNIIVTKEPK